MAYTTAPLVKLLAVTQDSEGEVSTQIGWSLYDNTSPGGVYDTLAQSFADALVAMSQTQVIYAGYQVDSVNTRAIPARGTGTDDTEDKALLELAADTDGTLAKYNVPAPKTTDFLTDEETVDPTATAVAAFITFAKANLTTRTGATIAAYVKGYRRRAKTRRKLRQGIAQEIGG